MSVLAAVGHNNLAIITTSSNGSLGFNSDSWRCRSSTSTFQLTCQVSQSSISILASFYLQYTVLENRSKSLILLGNFNNHHMKKCVISILAFLINFCPFKTDLSGNTVWTKVSGFQNSPKSMIFGIFNELCPLKKCKRSSLRSHWLVRLFSMIFQHCACWFLPPTLRCCYLHFRKLLGEADYGSNKRELLSSWDSQWALHDDLLFLILEIQEVYWAQLSHLSLPRPPWTSAKN